MSRFYEALKKAEQERAGGGSAGNPLGEILEDLGLTTSREAMIAGLAARTVGKSRNMPTLAAPLSIQQLQQHGPPMIWNPKPEAILWSNSAYDHPGVEQFHNLRSRLHQIQEKVAIRSVIVTSALPGEGKSFVVSNLALALSRQNGKRVLLVDADLRAPRIHSVLGVSSSPGLTDYLLGESDERSIIQWSSTANLFFLPCGRQVDNPLDLLGDNRLKALLERVNPLFDWILLDTSPALPVSDARLLAGVCDGVLLVVRAGSTRYDLAYRAKQEFQNKVLGVILNRAEPKDGHMYCYSAYDNRKL
jgi:protein-tyrosine kinase